MPNTPTLRELEAMLAAMGWRLTKLLPPTPTSGKFVAKGSGPAGSDVERDGDTQERAVANLLSYAQQHNAIRAYAALKDKLAMWHTPWSSQLEEIGQAYGKLPVYDEKAVPAWHALANESKLQADAIRGQINVDETDDPEPYPHHAAMLHDIHHKQNYVVSRAHGAHPVWSSDELLNYRIAHDVLGHAQSGGGFDWEGENRAAAIHLPMVSPLARRALFTEALGQTAYALHKGSHAHGPQKVGVLPDFLDPVEQMNGDHVHVPHGKLIYPEYAAPAITNRAWRWYQDPETQKWQQELPSESPSGPTKESGRSFRHAITIPGAPTYAPPHGMTPQEYPARPDYRALDPQTGLPIASVLYPSPDEPDILPETVLDPNHYYHTAQEDVAPLTQTGSPDDYLNRQAVEDNVNHYDNSDTKWWDESPGRQRDIIRNAIMVSILSPKKPLMWNAAHYQAMMGLSSDAPLGDYFTSYLKAKDEHNEANGQEPTAYGLAYTMKGNWRPELALIQRSIKHEGVSDAEAWKQAKAFLFKLYKGFEPYAEHALRHENERRRNQPKTEKGEKQLANNEVRLHLLASEMVDDFLHQNIPLPNGAYRDEKGDIKKIPHNWVPGADLLSSPIDLDAMTHRAPQASVHEANQGGHNLKGRYMGLMYGQLEKIHALTPEVLEQLRQYAQKDIREDGGRGYIFRAGTNALNVPGIDHKTASLAWLLLCPHTSELGIIDTHAARGMGFTDKEVTANGGKNYHAIERGQRAIKDATGYGDMPLGKYHWGMWDMVKHPGMVSDHSALRPTDPHPWDDPAYPWPPEPQDAKSMPIYYGHHNFMKALAGPARKAISSYLAAVGGDPLVSRNLLGETSIDDPSAFESPAPPPDVRAAGTVGDLGWSDYVTQHNRDDRDSGEHQDISPEEMGRLAEEYQALSHHEAARPIEIPVVCPYCTLNSTRGQNGCTCGYLDYLKRMKAEQDSENGQKTAALHRVTLPDGNTETRNSEHTYTHAVAVKDENGWGVYGWRSNEGAANKEAQRVMNFPSQCFSDSKVLPVERDHESSTHTAGRSRNVCPNCGAQLKPGIRDWCQACRRKVHGVTHQADYNGWTNWQELYEHTLPEEMQKPQAPQPQGMDQPGDFTLPPGFSSVHEAEIQHEFKTGDHVTVAQGGPRAGEIGYITGISKGWGLDKTYFVMFDEPDEDGRHQMGMKAQDLVPTEVSYPYPHPSLDQEGQSMAPDTPEQIRGLVGKVGSEFVPNGADMPFKPGDRVQVGGSTPGYGTVVSVEPAAEDYMPEECEMCGAPTENNLNVSGRCNNCGERPHEHDDSIMVRVKLDSGQTVNAADWMLKLTEPLTDAPDTIPWGEDEQDYYRNAATERYPYSMKLHIGYYLGFLNGYANTHVDFQLKDRLDQLEAHFSKMLWGDSAYKMGWDRAKAMGFFPDPNVHPSEQSQNEAPFASTSQQEVNELLAWLESHQAEDQLEGAQAQAYPDEAGNSTFPEEWLSSASLNFSVPSKAPQSHPNGLPALAKGRTHPGRISGVDDRFQVGDRVECVTDHGNWQGTIIENTNGDAPQGPWRIQFDNGQIGTSTWGMMTLIESAQPEPYPLEPGTVFTMYPNGPDSGLPPTKAIFNGVSEDGYYAEITNLQGQPYEGGVDLRRFKQWIQKGWVVPGDATSRAPNAIPLNEQGKTMAPESPEQLEQMVRGAAIDPLPRPSFEPAHPIHFEEAKAQNRRPENLSPKTPEDYEQAQAFLTPDRKTGYMVDHSGDLQNLFNNGKHGRGIEAMLDAVKQRGASTLDAYDGFLPRYYNQFGFQETGRMPFVDEYAPAGWDAERLGRPDVVFMAYQGGPREDLDQRLGQFEYHPTDRYFEDWDEAKNESASRVSDGPHEGRAARSRLGALGDAVRLFDIDGRYLDGQGIHPLHPDATGAAGHSIPQAGQQLSSKKANLGHPVNTEEYLERAGGNPMAARQAMCDDLVDLHGYTEYNAWAVAKKLIDSYMKGEPQDAMPDFPEPTGATVPDYVPEIFPDFPDDWH